MQNVAVDTTGPEWWVKVADFGFSKLAIDDHLAAHTGGGTPLYMAPEMQGVFESDGTYRRSAEVSYTKAVDIWAVGVVAFQMLAGNTPFRQGEVDKYAMGKRAFPEPRLRQAGASYEACAFVRSLIATLPNRRPSALECLQQSYWLQDCIGLPDSPTRSSHNDPDGNHSVPELQKESGTRSSGQNSTGELRGHGPASGGDGAANKSNVPFDTATPQNSPGNLVPDAEKAGTKASPTIAPVTDTKPHTSNETANNLDSLRLPRPNSVQVKAPPRSTSRDDPAIPNARPLNLVSESQKHMTTAIPSETEIEGSDDSSSDGSDDSYLKSLSMRLSQLPNPERKYELEAGHLKGHGSSRQGPPRSSSAPTEHESNEHDFSPRETRKRTTVQRSQNPMLDPIAVERDGKAEYIKFKEGRPYNLGRRGSGKPQPRDDDVEDTPRRRHSRERRPYSSQDMPGRGDSVFPMTQTRPSRRATVMPIPRTRLERQSTTKPRKVSGVWRKAPPMTCALQSLH